MLTRFALERLLRRLSVSSYRERFILKGALLFVVWLPERHRATKDLDLAGRGDPSPDVLKEIFRSLCMIDTEEDGIRFLAETVTCTEIREETEYGGLRVNLTAILGTAEIPVQVDVGFGDVVTPAPEEVEFPVLLNLPAPRLHAYPKETVIAEKFEAMVSLELGNSRMKDFYDIWTLARMFTFQGETLTKAISTTFARRGTPIPNAIPVALTEEFATNAGKQAQWQAFCRRTVLRETAPALEHIVAQLSLFLLPPLRALQQQIPFRHRWEPETGWSEPNG